MTQNILTRQGKPALAYNRLSGTGPTVVFLGGFMSDMTGSKALALEDHCRHVGAPYVRFDYTGCGLSEGVFEECSIATWASDVVDVLEHLTSGPLVVVGSSMGGWLTLWTALNHPERLLGVVGLASAPDFTERLMWPQMPLSWQEELSIPGAILELPSAYADSPYRVSHTLMFDSKRCLILNRDELSIHMPVRLFHGLADPDVPWELSLEAAQKMTGHDCRLTLIKDGDHTLSRPQDIALFLTAVEEIRALGVHKGCPSS